LKRWLVAGLRLVHGMQAKNLGLRRSFFAPTLSL
jgi:hypothetical protein